MFNSSFRFTVSVQHFWFADSSLDEVLYPFVYYDSYEGLEYPDVIFLACCPPLVRSKHGCFIS